MIKVIISGPAMSGKSTIAFLIKQALEKFNVNVIVDDPDYLGNSFVPNLNGFEGKAVEIEFIQTPRSSKTQA